MIFAGKIEKKNKKFNIKMDVLSREKLQTAINKHPTVLHLICHGAYCKKEKDVNKFDHVFVTVFLLWSSAFISYVFPNI